MIRLRVGTRGSDLALWQTRWVCRELRRLHPAIEIEEVIISTHGDKVADRPFGGDWPVGAFVHAIEQALLQGRIDLAVHSFKDLQTAITPGLAIAAVPPRGLVHDVLLTRHEVGIDSLPTGFRIGTSSPRRAAQFRRLGVAEIVPIRGNVPTRVEKMVRGDVDGVVLAAAGLDRLEIGHRPRVDLPVERFVPAPAQGALAVQARANDEALEVASQMDDRETRAAVEAERSFLGGINAGCHTPAAALARVGESAISLHAQLFTDDGRAVVEAAETGPDPAEVGLSLARRLSNELPG